MSYEQHKGFIIESVQSRDVSSSGKPITKSVIVIRRLGHPKLIKEALTIDDARLWIDKMVGGEA